MSYSPILFIIGTLATLAKLSSAEGFIKMANVSTVELESSMLQELSGSVAMKSERIRGLENTLEPLFTAVPKDGHKTLGHAVVRYVLHRFFSQQRGWYILGLEPAGDARNVSLKALKDMQDWAPSYLQSFLEQHVGKRGLNLQEVTAFAAALEDLVLKEEANWLDFSYSVLALSKSTKISEEQLMEVLETYMMLYTIKGNFTAATPAKVHHLHDLFKLKVKNWKDTKEWVHRLVRELFPLFHKFTFDDSLSIVKMAGQRYSGFYEKECGMLKSTLVNIESTKAGRVRLVDFYKQALNGSWDFDEKIEYLRALGALDESDPSTPLVIIPNYVSARPNCLMTSSFYAICCRNTCEDLMQSLEAKLHEPMADPQDILQFVTVLPSDTVPAPRKISAHLVQRLDHVAKLHKGRVPLHGRLFAQWMHHAFPRECPFPHEAGAASPMTPDQWMSGTEHTDSKASEEEMRQQVSSDSCKLLPHGMVCGSTGHRRPSTLLSKSVSSRGVDDDLPWKDVEELLDSRPDNMDDRVPPFYRVVLFLALLPTTLLVALYTKGPRKSHDMKSTSRNGMSS